MSLRIQNLEVTVGTFQVRIAELDVASGELICLMGRSGSGKSTLLSAISGFTPCRGTIEINGVDVSNLPPERRRIALAFQRSALFTHLSVQGNVEFGLRIQGVSKEDAKVRAKAWLERLSIGDLADRRPSQISEGQAQRVALARALVVGFPVLLLDEPFSALDEETRATLREELRGLVRETSTSAILVTHFADDAAVADSRYVVEQGVVTAVEPSVRR